jgi:hypothetical protein
MYGTTMGVQVSNAEARYDRAMANIRKGLTFKNGGPSAETNAAEAHAEMVREGTASPIKRKYVVGRYLKKVRS